MKNSRKIKNQRADQYKISKTLLYIGLGGCGVKVEKSFTFIEPIKSKIQKCFKKEKVVVGEEDWRKKHRATTMPR